MVACQHFARAAETRLDLIGDEEHAVLAADPSAVREIAASRNANACFALHRLQQESTGIRRNRALERLRIAERHDAHAGHEWAEAIAILRLGRERDCRKRASVEIAFAGDDLALVLGDALDAMGPFARGFDRGLDGFGAGIHRQRHIHVCHGARSLEKWSQAIRVERSRND